MHGPAGRVKVEQIGHAIPFVPNVLFLYPLKTSENLKVFWCFQGVEKGCIGNEQVKIHFFQNWKKFTVA